MSIFGRIVSAIFGRAKAEGAAPEAGAAGAEAGSASASGSGGGSAPQPMSRQQVEAMIQKVAESSGNADYKWKQSIVDLMKLLKLDSSLDARKELARELGYGGELNGSAEMNIWLHQQVMTKLMESGGRVPDSLR